METMEISSPLDGQVIGSLQQEWTWWYPNYKIKNQNGATVLRIKGSCPIWTCGEDINFKVNSKKVKYPLKWHFIDGFFFVF